jgi:hypothetical protein
MTTTKETAAYVAASLTAQLKLDTMLEISKAWAQFYDTALEKMGFEPGYDTVPAQKPAGGRDIPIRKEVVPQDAIMGKIATVGRIIPVRSGELPKDATEWAEKRGIEYVYDNRAAQAENSKRPAFKAVNEAGQDIKMEDGKSLSYWGQK